MPFLPSCLHVGLGPLHSGFHSSQLTRVTLTGALGDLWLNGVDIFLSPALGRQCQLLLLDFPICLPWPRPSQSPWRLNGSFRTSPSSALASTETPHMLCSLQHQESYREISKFHLPPFCKTRVLPCNPGWPELMADCLPQRHGCWDSRFDPRSKSFLWSSFLVRTIQMAQMSRISDCAHSSHPSPAGPTGISVSDWSALLSYHSQSPSLPHQSPSAKVFFLIICSSHFLLYTHTCHLIGGTSYNWVHVHSCPPAILIPTPPVDPNNWLDILVRIKFSFRQLCQGSEWSMPWLLCSHLPHALDPGVRSSAPVKHSLFPC
jgi:hypothetical protein